MSSAFCTLSYANWCQRRLLVFKMHLKHCSIYPGRLRLSLLYESITLLFFVFVEPFSEIHSLHHAARSSIVERSIFSDGQKTTFFSVQHVVVFEQKIKLINLKLFPFCVEYGR